jgi:hypothetical protein
VVLANSAVAGTRRFFVVSSASIRNVTGVKQLGSRTGNWLTRDQASLLFKKADGEVRSSSTSAGGARSQPHQIQDPLARGACDRRAEAAFRIHEGVLPRAGQNLHRLQVGFALMNLVIAQPLLSEQICLTSQIIFDFNYPSLTAQC